MSQYGSGPIVYRAAHRATRQRAIHADEDCPHLKNVRSVLDKPLPSLGAWVRDGDIPTCDDCWDWSEYPEYAEYAPASERRKL